MKKITLIMAGAVLLFALPTVPTYAEKCEDRGPFERFERGDDGCKPQHVKVPETNSFVLLATGLTALGGLAMVTRKKLVKSKQ